MKNLKIIMVLLLAVFLMTGCSSEDSKTKSSTTTTITKDVNDMTMDEYAKYMENKYANDSTSQAISNSRYDEQIFPSWLIWIFIIIVIVYICGFVLMLGILLSRDGREPRIVLYAAKFYGFPTYSLIQGKNQLLRDNWNKKYIISEGDGWHADLWWVRPTTEKFFGFELSQFRPNKEISQKGNKILIEGKKVNNDYLTTPMYGLKVKDLIKHIVDYEDSNGTPPHLKNTVEKCIKEAVKCILKEVIVAGVKTYQPDPTTIIENDQTPELNKLFEHHDEDAWRIPVWDEGTLVDYQIALDKAIDMQYDSFDISISFSELDATSDTKKHLDGLDMLMGERGSITDTIVSMTKKLVDDVDGMDAKTAASIAKEVAVASGKHGAEIIKHKV